jgi:hypothetical protein
MMARLTRARAPARQRSCLQVPLTSVEVSGYGSVMTGWWDISTLRVPGLFSVSNLS